MKTRGRRGSVTLLLCLLTIRHVKTDGKLDIRFISYWSDGKEISGDCCDNDLPIWCNNKCDPKFTLCIDGPDGVSCSLYIGTTNYIDNHNTINFGSSILGTANPIIIPVPKAVPSSIQITVQVYDHDDISSDDHMDTLSKRINIQAAATEQTAVYSHYTVSGRTTLQIEVRAYCDPDWYGSGCETYCKATPYQSHYTCNKHTGAKVCFEGWEGDICDQDIDECAGSNMCQHGGSCTNTPGRFECICIEGIKGRRCEIITNQCTLKPCLNGGTCDGNEIGFNCACSVEWTGETCEEMINFCASAPCNRGTCTPDRLTATGFKCDCDFAWVGERCSQSVDTVNITLLGGIDHTNRGDLTDGLNRLIAELGEIPGKVDVKLTTSTQTECNYTTTYVQLYSALENGTFLDSASVNMIFESNHDEVLNEYLPLPLYPPRQEEKSTVKINHMMPTERSHDSWDTDQYVLVVLLPLGLVLMTVLLLAAFGIWKRKSDKSQCTDDDNDQISSFEMDVPCSRNPDKAGTITGNLQDASISPDGYTRLLLLDVDEGTLDTHSDDTSNIHRATGDMTLDSWSREGASVSPDDNARLGDVATLDTRRHVTSYIQPVTGDVTLDPCSQEGASVSPDGNARLDDVATLDTRRRVTSYIQPVTGYMTLDSWSREGASVPPDDNARLGDVAILDTRRHVTSYIQPVTGDMTLDPCSQEGARVSPDGNARLDDVATLDTRRRVTSYIQPVTGYMTLDSWSREGASVPPDDNARLGDVAILDTRRHVTSYIQPVTGDMTLDPCSQEGASVSPDGNARLDDVATLDTRRRVTSYIEPVTGDMTLVPCSQEGASVSPDDNARLGDVATLDSIHLVASYIHQIIEDMTGDPWSLQGASEMTIDPCHLQDEEEDEYTVIDDNDVENISQEDPYEKIRF